MSVDDQMDGAIVRTVTGDRAAADFAAVMIHEHVLFDIVPPAMGGAPNDTIHLHNRWQVNYGSNAVAANAHQRDPAIAIAEVAALKADGGDLIVDQSVHGLARDPAGLRQVATATGCAIVASAGTYTAPYLDAATLQMAEGALEARFIQEVCQGLDGTDVRAGLIGEIGCSFPLEPIEARALKAAARASVITGAGLSIHPGRDPRAPFEIVTLLEREGADLSRCVICHMDRTYPDGIGPLELAGTGVNVEWDFFGVETSHYWMDPDVELPTDRARLRTIRRLFDAGLSDRVLISQDICTKTRLQSFGGHGYGHILRNVRALMARVGYSLAEIDRLIRLNPLRVLAIPHATAAPTE
ncbi:MAG: aryldialkylphosphatase [Pseudomonadota bacterium]